VLLSLGYFWGKRQNEALVRSVFSVLTDVLEPQDQHYTRIGGLTGYHANLVPRDNRVISEVEATMTLLPREAWLYYPICLLVGRGDRLYVSLNLNKTAAKPLKEGHLIERSYACSRAGRITNADKLPYEEVHWGSAVFFLYYEDREVRGRLMSLKDRLSLPRSIRHVALVPEKRRVFIFMIPSSGAVSECLPVIRHWVEDR